MTRSSTRSLVVSRRRPAVLRVAGAVGMLALLGGVPVVLVGVGTVPSPAAVMRWAAHPGAIGHQLAHPLSGSTVSAAVVIVAWTAWTWLVLCAAVELRGAALGRAPRRLPASRHIQSLVAFLVGALVATGVPSRQPTLRFETRGLLRTPAAVLAVSATPAHVRTDGAGMSVAPEAGGDRDASRTWVSATSAPTGLYVVEAGDTLWSIAQRQLGSPLRWRSIAEANYGRPQPDGGALLDDHWIRPGWRLVIPGAAPAATPDALTGAPGPAPSRQRAIDTANVVRNGAGAVSTPTGHRAPPASNVGTGLPVAPVVPIGYGLLGAGAVALLDRMRRAQQRRRPRGLRIALPDGDLAELERGLRVAVDRGSVDWIDLSLRYLSLLVQRESVEPPSVLAVRLRDEAIEFLLETDLVGSDPPAPFERDGTGRSWLLPRTGRLLESLRGDREVIGHDAPLPSLVTLGRDEHGLLVVNIERAGSIAVSGEGAHELIQAMATELATAAWADQIDLVLVGFGDDVHGLERVSHASSLRTAALKLERRIRERRALLALGDHLTTAETRWVDGSDAWDLCVVVCSPEASSAEVSALQSIVRLAGDGSLGVVVVAGTEVATARWKVHAHGGRVSVDGSGHPWPSLSSQHVPRNLVEGVNSLMSLAAITEGVDPHDHPYEKLSLPIPEESSHDTSGDAGPDPSGTSEGLRRPRPEVEVRVLGQVDIVGADRPFTRAWAVELVVYLAMHPAGVSNDQWSTALWPDKVMAPASLHSTASAARRSLGTSADGTDHLPRARGRLALGPGVGSDWDEFVALSNRGEPGRWREALTLIRGRPFEGLRAPDWVLLEGILATIEAVVVDVACRFAEHCLASFDAPGAEWAARQALRVSPYDERLYRILLRAADAAGNPAGVESVMAELVHLVAEDVEPFDAVHPETFDLYRRLSRRSVYAARSDDLP